MSGESVFWDDLAADFEDPEFLRTFLLESIRIKTIDAIVNGLNDAREAASLSKAALARAASIEPASVRRLFGAHAVNPTLGTVSELAAALGLRLTLQPLEGHHRQALSDALIAGEAGDRGSLREAVKEFDKARC
ncbi:helix-turn-helix domain-containing protein [Skermania sp. ID1734]|uniref:helix-turn-helix domain-containing protein n=1 Tax=Skermania sp. ID1734 TaxID=2597516 RepID=UPI00163D918A|nr:helix-turn-helix domain-containing protein [Skermania sp. ID1734]